MSTSYDRAHSLFRMKGNGGHRLHLTIWIAAAIAFTLILVYRFIPGTGSEKISTGKETSRQISHSESKVEMDFRPSGEAASYDKIHPDTSYRGSSTFEGGYSTFSMGGVSTAGKRYSASDRNPALARSPHADNSSFGYSEIKQLIQQIVQMKPRQGRWSQEQIVEINRLLQELRQQGEAGLRAIREFLESGQDVSFGSFSGKLAPEFSSLRLAMIDVLSQIGGEETAAFLAGMLPRSRNPEEIAILAKAIEQSAPGVYRTEIIQIARAMLEEAIKTPPGQFPGLGHLFGVIQDYGDASIVSELESMCRARAPSVFTEYAMMALSKIPGGAGIPSLLRMVGEMAQSPQSYGITYDMGLRYLAQASREYREAADFLLRLAEQNRIGQSGFLQIATALGGTEYGLITKSSELSQQTRAEIGGIRAIERWTDAEIDQRLSMIDRLLRYNLSSSAAKALQEARNRLLAWRERPLVDGKRVYR